MIADGQSNAEARRRRQPPTIAIGFAGCRHRARCDEMRSDIEFTAAAGPHVRRPGTDRAWICPLTYLRSDGDPSVTMEVDAGATDHGRHVARSDPSGADRRLGGPSGTARWFGARTQEADRGRARRLGIGRRAARPVALPLRVGDIEEIARRARRRASARPIRDDCSRSRRTRADPRAVAAQREVEDAARAGAVLDGDAGRRANAMRPSIPSSIVGDVRSRAG